MTRKSLVAPQELTLEKPLVEISGLFDEIAIKTLGKTDGYPFQVLDPKVQYVD